MGFLGRISEGINNIISGISNTISDITDYVSGYTKDIDVRYAEPERKEVIINDDWYSKIPVETMESFGYGDLFEALETIAYV